MSKIRRWLRFMLLGALVCVLLSACLARSTEVISQDRVATNCRTIQHALGETCVPLQPQRLIVLGVPTLGDALALGVLPIASIVYFDDPPPYLVNFLSSVQILGREEQPNLEKILALQPDLIIGMRYATEAIYDRLTQIAPTVVDDWEGYPSWRDHFNFVATVLNKTEAAQQVWANYQQRIAALQTALGDRLPDLEISFVHICCGTIDIDLSNSFNGSILTDVGFRRPEAQAAPIAGGITSLSTERLMDIESDVLFIATDGESSVQKMAELQRNPLWQSLRAVQQDRVYPVNYPTWRGGNPLAAHAVLDDLFRYLTPEERSS